MNAKLLYFILFILILGACVSSDDKDLSDSIGALVEKHDFELNGKVYEKAEEYRFHKVINELPTPTQVMQLMEDSKLNYYHEFLYPIELQTIDSDLELAISYGYYVADLGYVAIYGENSDLLDYFVMVSRLANRLECEDLLNDILKNSGSLSNRDSILKLTERAFGSLDKYLTSEDRYKKATFMIIGSWIESQHIGFNVLLKQADIEFNQDINDEVFKQRLHVLNLIHLLNEYKSEEGVKEFIDKMYVIHEKYSDLKNDTPINKDQVQMLLSSVDSLRNSWIETYEY